MPCHEVSLKIGAHWRDYGGMHIKPLDYAAIRSPYGGRHVTDYLYKLLGSPEYADVEAVNDVKEKLGLVAMDLHEATKTGTVDTQSYTLPNNRVAGLLPWTQFIKDLPDLTSVPIIIETPPDRDFYVESTPLYGYFNDFPDQ
eukprot:gene15938-18947_t